MRGLTFELTGRAEAGRRKAGAGDDAVCGDCRPGLRWPAVARPVERGVMRSLSEGTCPERTEQGAKA